MSAGVEIRPAILADDAARDAYVRAHAEGSFFHLAGWRRAVERVMGHAGRDLLAFRGGALVGVLPLVECRGLLGGRSWISMPYAVYGGPLGDDAAVARALFEEAERQALRRRVGRLELRCRADPGLDLPGSELYATFARALPDDPAEVLERMPKKARADARRARSEHGLELSEGAWFVGDLVRLFHENKRALGSPALPGRWFHALLEEHPGEVTVHLVRRGDEPLAAVMSFLYDDQVLAYYSGTGEGVDRAYKASAFMYLALQEWCVERGYRVFDFGRSRRDSGAFDFKRRQGFEPRALNYRYRFVRDQRLPSLTPSNPRTRLLRESWSRLPRWITRALSTPASRYLP
jgi:FemAB-related protein (PEP-CTERM system-associated)